MQWGVARRQFSGVLLQLVCTLVEMVILQEERIAHSQVEASIKLSPSSLYALLSDHQLHLQEMVQELAK